MLAQAMVGFTMVIVANLTCYLLAKLTCANVN